jgi:hypothetical protein
VCVGARNNGEDMLSVDIPESLLHICSVIQSGGVISTVQLQIENCQITKCFMAAASGNEHSYKFYKSEFVKNSLFLQSCKISEIQLFLV